MSTQGFKAFEEAGCLAATMGVHREANPYVQATKAGSCHLLDQDSRQALAEAWWKGWERCQKDYGDASATVGLRQGLD
jgi:hypothetical protein